MIRRSCNSAATRTLHVLIAVVAASVQLHAEEAWPPTGKYEFSGWNGAPLNVFFSVPPKSNAATPVLIVIPGVKRNAREYREAWDHLATANRFISLVVEATKKRFPTEYDYNVGGVINAQGEMQPEEKWLFSAIDPLFDDFTRRFGSHQKTYGLYGHSAGGGFVHLFVLFKPNSKMNRAVAANPAFFMMPDSAHAFPFGLNGASLSSNSITNWYEKRLVVLLGEQDREPRTQPLSNGKEANQQGPNVFTRGLAFYRSVVTDATVNKLDLHWQLEVVPGVGHSDPHMASYAVKHLFPDRAGL